MSKLPSNSVRTIANKNVKHWSIVVSSSYGYELFINHLEREYSIENLLFLTEYLQLKFVIKKYYNNDKQIIDLISNNKQLQFNVDLPLPPQLLNINFVQNGNDDINDNNDINTTIIKPDLEIADEDIAPAKAPNIPFAILLSNIILIFSLPIFFGLNFLIVCSEAF